MLLLQVVEFDTPYSLVSREGGVLADLVAQTGDSSRERLVEMARQAHLASQQREDVTNQQQAAGHLTNQQPAVGHLTNQQPAVILLANQEKTTAPEDVSLSL